MSTKARSIQSTPERNNGPKLTIPVKTRSPLEAITMLRKGDNIDQMVGYYTDHGIDTTDFFLKDRIQKLHMLNNYRDRVKELEEKKQSLTNQIQTEYEKEVAQRTISPGGNNNGEQTESSQS